MRRFRDRHHAGDLLGELLLSRSVDVSNGIVLALPRGGVPVGAQVAACLGLPLDVFIVRKLGMPGHPEYAMGAIASGGITVVNEEAVRAMGIDEAAIERVVELERRELERRERLYRAGRGPLDLSGLNVILVDDGIATGSSMRAAVEAVRTFAPASVIVAVPVAPTEASGEFESLVDAFVTLLVPSHFRAVGLWYEDFTQTTDDEVRALLGS